MNVLEKKELKNAFIAFLCTWGLQLILGITVRNPLTLIFFGLFICIGRKVRENDRKGPVIPVLLVSFLLSAALVFFVGRRAVERFDSGLFKIAGVLIMLSGISLAIFRVMQFLFKTGDLLRYAESNDKNSVEKEGPLANTARDEGKMASFLWEHEGAIFAIGAIICFLCWLPYFLYEFPGIMTADSIVQYEQVIGVNPLSNHHPVAHTLIISLFYNLGMSVTGEPNSAISFYTLAQMIFLAICCGRVVLEVKRIVDKKRWVMLSLAFFALVPFNAVFAVTIWKDVPFAGIAMLLGCRICEMAMRDKAKTMDFVMFAFLAVLISVFRSNGWYAFLLCVPFFIFLFRQDILKAAGAVIFAIVVSLIIKGPVMNAAGIVQPDFTESLSLPLQQVARVLVSDEELDEKDIRLIDAVIDRTYIHELYAPDFADNIKELVRAGHPDVIENNKGEYFGLWLRLGMKFPMHYIRAWFDLEGGYVYPDIPYEVGNIDGVMPNDYGLVMMPRIGGKAVVKGKEILIKLGGFVPLYGMLWCAGIYTWLIVLLLVLMLRDRQAFHGRLLVFAIFQAALVFTLLIAAPVVDFRYEYAVVMLMPLSAAICAMIVKRRI